MKYERGSFAPKKKVESAADLSADNDNAMVALVPSGERSASDPYASRPAAISGIDESRPQDSPRMDRREFINKSIGSAAYLGIPTVLGAAAVDKAWQSSDGRNANPLDAAAVPPDPETPHSSIFERYAEREKLLERTMHMGGLTGRHLHGLAAEYLGVPKTVLDAKGKEVPLKTLPESYIGRPDKAFQNMWDRKPIKTADFKIATLDMKLGQWYTETLLRKQEHPTNLIEYMKSVEKVIRRTESDFGDFEGPGIMYQLDKDSISILRELAARISTRDLTAFSMTEVMSSGISTEEDMLAMDAVLRNNGEAFLMGVPAVFDSLQSFGPYQVTPLAMRIQIALDSKGKPYRQYVGASRMNRTLPDSSPVKIPEDIQNELNFHKFVEPVQHHSFGYQFALNNLAVTLGSLQMLNSAVRAEIPHISDDTLTSFIATSHHKPTASSAALIQHLQHTRKNDYRAFCAPKLQEYATRTLQNKQMITGIHT